MEHNSGGPQQQQGQVVVYVQQNVVKAPFKHGLHLVLDVVTCGLWLPIHLIAWALH